MSERILPLAAVLLLSGCARGLAQEETPAVIVNPTNESRAALVAAVSTALGLPSVTLAQDALTQDDLLIVERVRPRDAEGRPLSGRDLDRPEHFRLVKMGASCILVHERTSSRQVLAATQCIPR